MLMNIVDIVMLRSNVSEKKITKGVKRNNRQMEDGGVKVSYEYDAGLIDIMFVTVSNGQLPPFTCYVMCGFVFSPIKKSIGLWAYP